MLTLAKIWSLVNLTIPGKLFEHELYMALSLIALHQVRLSFNDFKFKSFPLFREILKLMI